MIQLKGHEIVDMFNTCQGMLRQGFAAETALYCLNVLPGTKLYRIFGEGKEAIEQFEQFPEAKVTLVDAL